MLSKLAITSHKVWCFVYFVARRFVDNGGTYRASALTFTSLLAIVPLLSVSFSVLSAFPVFNQLIEPIQNFIFENFVPDSSKVVQKYLMSFTEQASHLSVTGLIFLVATAIMMMYTIEQAMNQIWRVSKRRHGMSALLLYWGILTLGPLVMGLSLLLGSYLISLPFLSTTMINVGFNQNWLFSAATFFFALIAFTLFYVAIPNTKVLLRHGFLGGLFAAISFELVKYSFAFYIKQYKTYQLIYGAFAAVPIFFLWVYCVWVIILLGAEVAHGISAYDDRR